MNLPHLNGLAFIPLVALATYVLMAFILGNAVMATELFQLIKRRLEKADKRRRDYQEHMLRVRGHGNHFMKGGDL